MRDSSWRSLVTCAGWFAIAATLMAVAYTANFDHGTVTLTGTDAYGYLADARLMQEGVGPSGLSARLGASAFDSPLSWFGLQAPLVSILVRYSVSIAVALGAAALTAMALRIPNWAIAIVAVVAGAWGGAIRLAMGYRANLLNLAVFLVMVLCAVGDLPRRRRLVWCAFLAAVSVILHPLLLPFQAGVLGVAGIVEWLVAKRRDGPGTRLLQTRMFPTSLAVIGGGILALVVLLGVSGRDMSSLSNLGAPETRAALLSGRIATLYKLLAPWGLLSLTLGGLWFLRGMARRPRGPVLLRFGEGWLLASVLGVLVLVPLDGPFWRVIYLALPIALLAGLAVVGLIDLVSKGLNVGGSRAVNGPSGSGAMPQILAILATLALVAMGAQMWFRATQVQVHRVDWELLADEVAAYLEVAQPSGTVAVVGPPGLDPLTVQDGAKILATIRAVAPLGYAGRLTLVPAVPGGASEASIYAQRATAMSTPEIGSTALIGDPGQPPRTPTVLLAPRFDARAFSQLATERPGALASKDLLVVSGPYASIPAPAPSRFPQEEKLAIIFGVLAVTLLFAACGGGVARRLMPGDAPVAARLAFLPACGVALISACAGFAALLGQDPGGPVAVAALLAAVAASYLPPRTTARSSSTPGTTGGP